MEYKKATEFFQKQYKKLKIDTPAFHVVLGSALGGAIDPVAKSLNKWEKVGEFSFGDVPGLPTTKVAGHKGTFVIFASKGKSVIFQCGRVHGYEGHSPRVSVLPVMASRLAGCDQFLLTNASGSLNPKFEPGTAMVIRDHVNMTGQNPLVGKNPRGADGKELGPRFPDMSNVYDKEFSKVLLKALEDEKVKVNQGTYLGLMGPTYETPAEVKLFNKWGLDAVGMSTVWEAISLHHSKARVSGVALMTNYACGLTGEEVLDHEVLLKTTQASAEMVIRGVFRFLEKSI